MNPNFVGFRSAKVAVVAAFAARQATLVSRLVFTTAIGTSLAFVHAGEPLIHRGDAAIVSRSFQLQPIDARVKRIVVTAIANDPQGQWLAAAGDDHLIRVFHVDTLRLEHTLGDGSIQSGHTDLIRTIAFDPSGDRLASAGNDGRLILWDRRNRFAMMQVIPSAPALACVRFSPDGKQIAAVGFDNEVFLISKEKTQRPKLKCECRDLRCCVYRSNDAMLAVAGRDGYLHWFDSRSGSLLGSVSPHEGRIRDLAFLPGSGLLISVGEDGAIVGTDLVNGQIVFQKQLSSGSLFSLALLDNDWIAAAGSDDTIHVVQLDVTSKQLASGTALALQGHRGSVSTLTAVGGTLFSGGFDATLRRWDLNALTRSDPKIARGGDANIVSEPSPR